jgi:DNA-binding NarL/FixJ family response regulator
MDEDHHIMNTDPAEQGPPRTVQVVVLDHRQLVAEGLASLLREIDTLAIRAIATSREEYAACLGPERPDLVVVGIDDEYSEQTRSLLEAAVASRPVYRVVGVIGRADIDRITELLATGVSSLVSTAASHHELQQAVLDALSSAGPVGLGEIATIMIGLRENGTVLAAATATGGRRDERRGLPSLSPREVEVLRALVNGWSTVRIAQTLHISTNTVRTHVQNVLGKLGVHSKLEATATALRAGLLSQADGPASAGPRNISPPLTGLAKLED